LEAVVSTGASVGRGHHRASTQEGEEGYSHGPKPLPKRRTLRAHGRAGPARVTQSAGYLVEVAAATRSDGDGRLRRSAAVGEGRTHTYSCTAVEMRSIAHGDCARRASGRRARGLQGGSQGRERGVPLACSRLQGEQEAAALALRPAARLGTGSGRLL